MVVSRVSRAKQFLPFDALKGLQEALRQKEMEYEERKELSEESLTELDECFHKMEIGCHVKIRYYKNKKYIEVKGIVTNIDYTRKKIQINSNEMINISDIVYISI